MLDLARQHNEYDEQLTLAFKRVMKQNNLSWAMRSRHLNGIFRQLSGMEVVAVPFGTDALLVSLMALDVQLTKSSCPRLPSLLPLGLLHDLVQCHDSPISTNVHITSQLNPFSELLPNTKAIIPVHLFTVCLIRIAATCPENVSLLEDAAQSLSSRHGLGLSPKAVGATTSFFPTKNLGGMGDGGAVFSSDLTFVERVKMLRVHGAKPKYTHHAIGGNFRLDAMQACLLDIKLKHLSSTLAKRRQIAATYSALFTESGLVKEGWVRLPETLDGNVHSFNQFVIRVSRRDALKEHLSKNGVQSMIYYPSPLHLQPCFRHLGYQSGDFPVAEQACRDVLAIPCFPGMTLIEQRRVVMNIRSFYEG